MDKSSRIILALICAFMAYWLLIKIKEQEDLASVPQSQPPAPQIKSVELHPAVNAEEEPRVKTMTTAQPQKMISPAKAPQSEALKVDASQKKQESMPPYFANMMRWKNINGWAVTHGDILLGKIKGASHIKFGNFKPRPNRLWPSNIIPYIINKDVYDSSVILGAIKTLNESTVIKLVPYKNQSDALVFTKFAGHCASYLGKVLAFQPIMLSEKCGEKEIIHEILHALGFVHEQSRPDRDKYVEIIFDNIQSAFINQFDIISDELIHDFSGSVFFFDYQSIMLYSSTAFAKKTGDITIRSRTSTLVPSKKSGLSPVDIERLYFLYGQ